MESALEIVKNFYESAGILNKTYCLEVFHEDIQLEWHSSKGHLFLEHTDLLALSKDLKHSYFDLRAQIHDIMSEDDKVMIRYTHYVRTFENPEEELKTKVSAESASAYLEYPSKSFLHSFQSSFRFGNLRNQFFHRTVAFFHIINNRTEIGR